MINQPNDSAKELPANALRIIDAFTLFAHQGMSVVESFDFDEATNTLVIKSKRNSLGRIRVTVAMEGE